MLELHCAHGYLLSSFLSPLTNRRDRRIWRLDTRTARAIRSRCSARSARSGRSDKPISVRLSCHDWYPTAATRRTTRAIFARLFKEAGADLIDCSSGQV